MTPPSDDITPKVLLDHMQNMQRVLLEEIRKVRLDVQTELRKLREEMTQRFVRLESKVDLLSQQIGNIDERVDTIEVVELPKVKQAVGLS